MEPIAMFVVVVVAVVCVVVVVWDCSLPTPHCRDGVKPPSSSIEQSGICRHFGSSVLARGQEHSVCRKIRFTCDLRQPLHTSSSLWV